MQGGGTGGRGGGLALPPSPAPGSRGCRRGAAGGGTAGAAAERAGPSCSGKDGRLSGINQSVKLTKTLKHKEKLQGIRADKSHQRN